MAQVRYGRSIVSHSAFGCYLSTLDCCSTVMQAVPVRIAGTAASQGARGS